MSNVDEFAEKRADHINVEAVEWALRHERGAWSHPERTAFESWYAADLRHVRAYRNALRTLGELTLLRQVPDFSGPLPTVTWRERTALALAPLGSLICLPRARIVFATAAAVAAALILLGRLCFHTSAYETAVGEARAVTLEDGTRVTLGAGSRIEINFAKAKRGVILAHGEAYFEVAKNPARPFVVTAGETVVRVVGTKFDVHRGAREVRVSVLEGAVQVYQPDEQASSRLVTQSAVNSQEVDTVTAGQEIIARGRGSPQDARVTAIVQPETWQSGRLDYNGANLREVVADVTRYYPAGIKLESEDLGDLKVTTSFRPSQLDKMVDTLTLALPIEVERQGSGTLVLRWRRK
jgi:transmembrane sensor